VGGGTLGEGEKAHVTSNNREKYTLLDEKGREQKAKGNEKVELPRRRKT